MHLMSTKLNMLSMSFNTEYTHTDAASYTCVLLLCTPSQTHRYELVLLGVPGPRPAAVCDILELTLVWRLCLGCLSSEDQLASSPRGVWSAGSVWEW